MKEKYLENFTEHTELKKYLSRVEKLIDNNQNDELYKNQYKIIVESNNAFHHNVFLSVIVRTQGKRENGLREALLCLKAQSCQDFEVLLIGHKLTNSQKHTVETVLGEQDSEFREKIRFFELNYGGRSVPLNFGFANAHGQYVAIFDDDDILFSNWVESFKNYALENYGRILHSYAFSQKWSDTKIGYRAEDAPKAQYCFDYDLISQLSINRCPLMTLAFPADLFQTHGFIFDETLNVTEDWDFFMRTSFLCGVTDIPVPTAIYRFWENIETSATLHDESEWANTYKEIQSNFEKQTLLLNGKNVHKIIGLQNNSLQKSSLVSSHSELMFSRLYFSIDTPFNDENCIVAKNDVTLPKFDIWFLFSEKRNDIQAFRFDLTEDGLFLLRSLEIVIWFTNGEKETIEFDECVHNGIKYNNKILFLHEDPEIIWEWNDERLVDVVHISGEISNQIGRKKILNKIESLLRIKDRKKCKRLHAKGLI